MALSWKNVFGEKPLEQQYAYQLNANENKTPAEVWFNQKSNMNKIRVFGCNAYSYKSNENRYEKLNLRSQKPIMIGYAENEFRLRNIKKETVEIARNVIFDEGKKDTLSVVVNDIRVKNTENHETPRGQQEAEERDGIQRMRKSAVKLPKRFKAKKCV